MSATGELVGDLLTLELAGRTLAADEAAALAAGHAGAVLLFERNVGDREQLRALIQAARAAARRPLLVLIDHEGGRINRLRRILGGRVGADALGRRAAAGDLAAAEAAGREAAADLRALDIDVNLAPILDLGAPAANPALRERTFGDDPALVAACALAYLEGLRAGGVTGVVKHFPGLGATAVDPHTSRPLRDAPRATLDAVDLAPFRLALAQGEIPAVMVTHTLVPALDPSAPASCSRLAIEEVLRGALGFGGLVVADSLRMGAIARTTSLPQACVRAVVAGCDLLLGPRTPDDVAAAHSALVDALAEGQLKPARVEAAATRLHTFRARVRGGDR